MKKLLVASVLSMAFVGYFTSFELSSEQILLADPGMGDVDAPILLADPGMGDVDAPILLADPGMGDVDAPKKYFF